jgi:hypothetical protein
MSFKTGLLYLKRISLAAGIFSPIALLFYFSPWISNQPQDALGYYLFALLWFLFAWWLFAILNIFFLIKLKLKKNPTWIWHLFSAVSIIISFIVFRVACINGIYLTV